MNNTLKIVVIAAAATALVIVVAAVGVGLALAQGASAWGNRSLVPAGSPGLYRAGGYGYGMMGGYGTRGGYGMMGRYRQLDGTPVPGYGYGPGGMMGGGYGWMNGMHQWMLTNGGMHTVVWNGLAKALDLTPDELNTELASKTLAQLADERGVSQADLATALEQSVKAGLDQAVTDGVLTREQANQMLSAMAGQYQWMLDRMAGGVGSGFGPGGCHGVPVPQTDQSNL